MTSRSVLPAFSPILSLLLWCIVTSMAAKASNPVVAVSSPTNNSQVSAPVHYVASATSPECQSGIAAIRIYIAPYMAAYTIQSNSLDTLLTLTPGTYNTLVQAWDNCGGVGKTFVNVTVAAVDLQPARFLYVADDANSRVWGFTVDPSTGVPSAIGQDSVATNSSYRLGSDRGGYRLYVTNAAPTPYGAVFAYFVNRRNGYLYPVPGSPFLLNATPGAVAVHPSGEFVFVGTLFLQPSDGIQILRVNPDGSLALVNSIPIATKSMPDSIVMDPWGKYLYVTSAGGSSIDGFAVDTVSGALTPLPGSPYTISTPGCINPQTSGMTDLYGRFLYMSDEGASEISGYAIEGNTGTLTELAGSPFPDDGGCPSGTASLRGLTTEPTGRFLYALDGNPFFHISIYSINAGNGVLTHVKDTGPISNGFVYGKLRTDPSGKFLYAAGDELIGFSINPVSGDLTVLPGSPFPIGVNVAAFDLAVTP